MPGNEMRPLFGTVKGMADRAGSRYGDRIKDRDELLAFMDANEWFGMPHLEEGGDFLAVFSDEVQAVINMWLKAYRKTDSEKAEMLTVLLAERFPRTGGRFREYVTDSGYKDARSAWKVMDYLAFALDKELDEYSEDEINGLISNAYAELKMKELSLLSAYLTYDGSGSPYTDWKYRFKSHQIIKPDNTAYSLEDFALMAYTVLNRESWADHGLIEKALDSKRYAQLWTFSAFHFICALRAADILRLPVPALPYDPETIRRMAREGTFPASDAYGIAFEFQYRCRMCGKRPHKTLKKGVAPEIKLFIPESLMEPLGFIMAVSLSFRKPEDPFVSIDFTLQDVVRFFGDDFARAAGYQRFKSRRANKSYVQGIGAAGGDAPGRPKGYMLASLARSHKGGIGKLAEITDVYLRDAKFTGEDAGFVIREMFERGIFGFIPCMLLEMYQGKRYRALGISEQTEMVKALGMEAWQIEAVAGTVAASYSNAGIIVKSTLDEAGGGNCLNGTLRRIASGSAASRQEECLCLRNAAGLDCVRPGGTSCLGCGYEIYTKTALQMLAREYVRLNRQLDDPDDGKRTQDILKKYIIPGIVQILQSVSALYPEADMDVLRRIIERGMEDADAC